MTRHCDVCGAPIGPEAGICPSCGFSHLAEGEIDDTTYGNPRWGVLTLKLPPGSRAQASALLQAVHASWMALEAHSFQKLAPSQLHLLGADAVFPVRLIGSYTSHVKLQSDFGDALQLEFEDASLAEVEDMLRRMARAGS